LAPDHPLFLLRRSSPMPKPRLGDRQLSRFFFLAPDNDCVGPQVLFVFFLLFPPQCFSWLWESMLLKPFDVPPSKFLRGQGWSFPVVANTFLNGTWPLFFELAQTPGFPIVFPPTRSVSGPFFFFFFFFVPSTLLETWPTFFFFFFLLWFWFPVLPDPPLNNRWVSFSFL